MASRWVVPRWSRVLLMAALSARRYHQTRQAFADRLAAEAKAVKVILVAVAR